MPRIPHPLDWLLQARGILFPWLPVCLGAGIALWFAAPREPGLAEAGAAGALALAGLAGRVLGGVRWHPVWIGAGMVALGFLMATGRGALVAAPVLDWRYYGPVEGRVVEVDRSAKDRIRLTLDRVALDIRGPPPERVRISLMSDQPWLDPVPGMRVATTAHLAPPQGPAEPGGFDFRRLAWFEGLGATGYTRTPVLRLAPAEGAAAVWLAAQRRRLAQAVMARIPGDAGGYAAAVMTGDRSGIGAAANRAMRDSNLYHLVSISGMHMGMLAAFVFGLVRYGLALVPPLALRLPAKKIGAGIALAAAAAYLALAGRDVATERAFIMVAVMLVAVLFDRRALSLRTVAIAALIVLALRPESLVNPGFQMSFAATVALVAAFGALRGLPRGGLPRWLVPALTLVFSSVVAGTATAPYAAAHFGRVADYGLVANLLAVPAMGVLVMPGAVIWALTAPLGLDAPALWAIEAGSRWTLYVAAQVAAAEGAVSGAVRPPGAVLPVLTLGGLWLVLWRGPVRLAGLAGIAAAFWLWWGAERPALLVAADGGQMGLRLGDAGRALARPGAAFVAEAWLEADGDMADAATAGRRAGVRRTGGQAVLALAGAEVVHLRGKTAAGALPGACARAALVVIAAPAPAPPPGCIVIDTGYLRRHGALALTPAPGGLRLLAADPHAGARYWTGFDPWQGEARPTEPHPGLPPGAAWAVEGGGGAPVIAWPPVAAPVRVAETTPAPAQGGR